MKTDGWSKSFYWLLRIFFGVALVLVVVAAMYPAPRGPVGATGPAGADGVDGDTGRRGPAGADGSEGKKGSTGKQGDTGASGKEFLGK